MNKSLTFVVLLCALGLIGCSSDIEKCVQAGLKSDIFYGSSKDENVKSNVEYKYRLICLHGPVNRDRPF